MGGRGGRGRGQQRNGDVGGAAPRGGCMREQAGSCDGGSDGGDEDAEVDKDGRRGEDGGGRGDERAGCVNGVDPGCGDSDPCL